MFGDRLFFIEFPPELELEQRDVLGRIPVSLRGRAVIGRVRHATSNHRLELREREPSNIQRAPQRAELGEERALSLDADMIRERPIEVRLVNVAIRVRADDQVRFLSLELLEASQPVESQRV
jgi:hypothetical protein